MRKTKIICTIGPASDSEEVVTSLIEAGMDISRHNFSHGTHEENGRSIELVKQVSKKLSARIKTLLDTKGPEVRTGKFADKSVTLTEGDHYIVTCGKDIIGDKTTCSISYKQLYKDVKIGDSILIADGLVALEVKKIEEDKIHCMVKNTGNIGSYKNVTIPGVNINLPAVTEQDVDDLKFGIQIGVDIVAASFIKRAQDVLDVRKILNENGGSHIQIFSKIENQEGVDNIDEIIEASDGIMVARGDLGVQIPMEEVPVVQKDIIRKCNKAGKKVITATQMMESMTNNPRPTRAEVSDVANAVLDGTDAVMLSGETASGKYPVDTVVIMSKVVNRIEKLLNDNLEY
jgi:pyruvate kinase